MPRTLRGWASARPGALLARLDGWRGWVPWRQLIIAAVVSRAVVLIALLTSSLLPGILQIPKTGLLGWDAAWYLRIADDGYLALPTEARRFFPLLPLLARVLGYPIGSNGVALLLISNVSAFGYAAVAARLALAGVPSGSSHGSDDRVARLMPAVVLFAPTGFVLVMGYTEALYGALVCVVLLSARRGQWWPVIAAGVLAGTLRPTGVLLTVPVVVEAVRGLRSAPNTERVRRLAAVAAPGVGLACYLGYAAAVLTGPLEPLQVQTASGLRGGLAVNPIGTARHAIVALFEGAWQETPALEHLPWIVLSVALLIAGRRLVPLSYLLFAAATILLGLTAHNFQSFERYTFSAVPLLLIAAAILARWPRRRLVTAGSLLILGIYSLATFLGVYVP